MKKIIFLISMAVISTVSYGQSIFDRLEDMDGVSSVVISKDLSLIHISEPTRPY